MSDLVLTDKVDTGELDVLHVSHEPRRNTGLVKLVLPASKAVKGTSEDTAGPLESLNGGLLLFPIPAGSSEVTKDGLEVKVGNAEVGRTVPS